MTTRRNILSFIVLLSLTVEGLSLSMNDILGFGYRRLVEPEAPRVIEVIRWRQPVCLTAAPGVLPCLTSLQNPTFSKDDKNSLKEDLKVLIDGNNDNEAENIKESFKSIDENIDESVSSGNRKSRTTSLPHLYSPRIIERIRLNNMGTSNFQNPIPNGGRSGKYLRVAPQERRQTIYEIKVVDSPVVANLIADTCLPDIGIPLCEEMNENSDKVKHDGSSSQYRKPVDSEKPLQVTSKPSISIPVVSGSAIEFWGGGGNGDNSQGISAFLNKPNVVQTDEEPAVEQVIVVQPTSPPGIFAGINGLFPLGGGNLFDIFYNPSGSDDKPSGIGSWNPLPITFPGILQIPQIPSIQQILYRPENDISSNQGIVGILTNGDNIPPGTGPPTEKPGIFGGLFASPSKPADFDVQASPSPSPSASSSSSSSLLGGIGNIFNPTNRPLVIERPNEKPLLVEKPVYVIERPAALGLLDIFQTGLQPTKFDSTEKPLVIKDPTYVFQKPVTNAPLFDTGLLPNWNIFNVPSTVPTVVEPEVHHPEEIIVTNQQIIAPTIVEVEVPPQIVEKPVVESAHESSESTAFSASAVSSNNSEGSSSAFSVSLATAENNEKDVKPAEKTYEANGDAENLLNEKINDDQIDVRNIEIETVDLEEKNQKELI